MDGVGEFVGWTTRVRSLLEASVNGVDTELVLLDDEILLFLLSCKCFIAVVELAFVAFLEAPSTPATTNNFCLLCHHRQRAANWFATPWGPSRPGWWRAT